jgi:NAD-dependent protein deacetylases, SIR2 family
MPFDSVTPEQCAAMIRRANAILVLTGAGISTAAGVPDFRGPKGLYVTRAYDPETVFDIHAFDRDPEPFYAFSRDFLGMLSGLAPTFTHRFLAELEQSGKNVAIVTQNIDGLHQKAGSRHVLPMHGDYETARCRRCARGITGSALRKLMEAEHIPRCSDCGGVIKPDVVFFGENVRHLDEATRLSAEADLLLALGSSLSVYPAALLPEYAKNDVVVVNQGDVMLRPGKRMHRADAGLDAFFESVRSAL